MSALDKACFIAIEGADGAGKSTFAEALYNELRKIRTTVLLEREPTSGPIGKRIREILQKKRTRPLARELADLFALDRLEHLSKQIIPALHNGATVISDRYTMSSFAYNHAADGVGEKAIAYVNRYAIKPDLTIVLHGPEEFCRARIRARGGDVELFERADALHMAWEYYDLAIRTRTDIHSFHMDAPIEQNVQQALALLSHRP